MSRCLVLVQTTVHQPEAFADYQALAGKSLKEHGATLVCKGAVLGDLEGASDHQRMAVLSFADEAAARAWYASTTYQEAVAARRGVATMRLSMVAG